MTAQYQAVGPVTAPRACGSQRADHQVRLVGRHLPGALAADLDPEARWRQSYLDLVIEAQCQSERIESRSEVGG